MSTEGFCFVDIETTGLDRDRHEIVEIAWAVGDGPIRVVWPRHTLRSADPQALRVNRYWERGLAQRDPSTPEEVTQFLLDARGRTLVAANPAFDAGFLQARFQWAPWRYRLLDVQAWAAGILRIEDRLPSLRLLAECATVLGYDIPAPDHSAAGDVATLRAVFQALSLERDLRAAAAPGWPGPVAELLRA